MKFGARLKTKIPAIAALLRDGEIARPLLIAAHAIPPSLLRIHLFVITRARSIPTFPARGGVSYRRFSPEQFPAAFPSQSGSPDPVRARLTRLMRRLRHGNEVFVAECDHGIMAYTVTAYESHYIPEVRFLLPLRADEACAFGSYVDPAYRRYSGVYPALASFLFSYLSGRGIRCLLGYTDFTNRHSIRTHQRLGHEQVGWVSLLGLPLGDLRVSRLDLDGGRLRWRLLPRAASRRRGPVEPDAFSAPRTANGGLRR